MERKETLLHFVRHQTRFLPSPTDTYDHVNDGVDGSHLGGLGVVCSGEVLSVVLVRGDERQPGVLIRHKKPHTVIPPGGARGQQQSLAALTASVDETPIRLTCFGHTSFS